MKEQTDATDLMRGTLPSTAIEISEHRRTIDNILLRRMSGDDGTESHESDIFNDETLFNDLMQHRNDYEHTSVGTSLEVPSRLRISEKEEISSRPLNDSNKILDRLADSIRFDE